MKDQYFAAYEAALQSLPEKQRCAFAKLMNAHGLRPDDPMIVGSVLTHMLLGRVGAVLNKLESATDPERHTYSVWALRTVGSILHELKSLPLVVAGVSILCSTGVAYTVHRADRFEEHDRVCVAAALSVERFRKQFIDHRYPELERELRGKAPSVCE